MSRLPWRRTVPPGETRPALEERIAQLEDGIRVHRHGLAGPQGTAPTTESLAVPAGRSADTVSRATYPMGDPALEASLKRADMTNRARKITLLQTYLGESWVSACVDAIANRLISGGWVLTPTTRNGKKANQASREPLLEYCNWCNQNEDLNQILASTATDLLWAGEAYLEVTWKRSPALKRDVPYELYTVDVVSMDYELSDDRKGIQGYVQTTDTGAPLRLEPAAIIRLWLPDPRNRLKALSPIEKLLNPVVWDQFIQLSEQKYFEQGNREDVAIILKSGNADLAGRFKKWFAENCLGVKNAHKPMIVYGDGNDVDVKTAGSRAGLDVLPRRQFARDEILAVYKVPPYQVGIVEHGGLGGTMSDALDKQFLHAAVDPIRQRIMATLNFRLAVQGFGIDDWVLDSRYADFRDTKEITQINDLRIRGGQRTVNEIRADEGKEPIPGGDVAIIVTSREVVPLRELPELISAQKQAAATQGTPLAPAPPAEPHEPGKAET